MRGDPDDDRAGMSPRRGVEIVHWNPRRNRLRFLHRFAIGPRVGNFGDLLGPLVTSMVLPAVGLAAGARPPEPRRLLTVGSILHLARDGDTVWGSGVNGKEPVESHRARRLDVRAVRGPATAAWVQEHLQIEVPPVFGDPALLLPVLLPELLDVDRTTRLSVVPNLHDLSRYAGHPDLVDPRGDPLAVVSRIARSEAVVTSSLHGLVVAEAFGIPCALVRAGVEPEFKYLDYAGGTGRGELRTFDDPVSATRYATSPGAAREPALAGWDPTALLDAFPVDLWDTSRVLPPSGDTVPTSSPDDPHPPRRRTYAETPARHADRSSRAT